MEPSLGSNMEDMKEILFQFHKHLIENDSISIFKVPNIDAIPAQEMTPQNIALHKESRCSQSSAQVELLDSGARCNTPRKKIIINDNNSTSDAGNEREPITRSKIYHRNLSASTTMKSKICHEMTQAPSLCSVTSTTKTTIPQRNMDQGKPTYPRVLHCQQPSYFSQDCSLRKTGKTTKKKCNMSFIQNCCPKIAQNVTFQHLNSMDSLQNKRSQLTRGSPTVRGETGQFSPPILSPAVSPTKKRRSVKKTKLTVYLPQMPDSTENQLISVFLEISKLHGCYITIDKKETAMRDEASTAYLPSHYTASSQQPTLAAGIKQRKSQQTTGIQQKSSPSYPNFSRLRALQAQLHSLGTQLNAIQPQQNIQQPQQLQESSDSDDPLPIYPEIIMQSTPPKSNVTEAA